MTKWNMRSKRKKSGGLRKRNRKKKKFERGRDFLATSISERKVKVNRTKGSGVKRILLSSNIANVIVSGKAQKTKIISVIDNKADSHFIRRNVITKGAIIDTELGQARVTSRPGQEGIVNAVLIETK